MKINWADLASKLKPETMGALNSFRARHTALTKTVLELKESPMTVDFEFYKSKLSRTAVVDEAIKAFKAFKPEKLDLTAQLSILAVQEKEAVRFSLI